MSRQKRDLASVLDALCEKEKRNALEELDDTGIPGGVCIVEEFDDFVDGEFDNEMFEVEVPDVEEPDILEVVEREAQKAELDALEQDARGAPTPTPPVDKKTKSSPKRKRKAAPKKAGPRSKVMRKIIDQHSKQTQRDAEQAMRAAMNSLGDKTADAAFGEARVLRGDVADLRKQARRERVRNVRAAKVSAQFAALAKQAAELAETDVEGAKKLLHELAQTGVSLCESYHDVKAQAERTEKRLVRLAERTIENSAQCASTAYRVATLSSTSHPALTGNGSAQGALAAMANGGGGSAPTGALVASDTDTLVAKVNQAKGTLSRISEVEHPRFAVRIGADGSSAIGASVRPAPNVIGRGEPGANVMPISLARQRILPQNRQFAQVNARLDTSRRSLRERERMRNEVRQMAQLALESGTK